MNSVSFARLRTFDLSLERRVRATEGERSVEWTDVAMLLSASMMPCLQHCSLLYQLSVDDDIEHIARSSAFAGDSRRARMQFVIHSNSASKHAIDEATLQQLRFGIVNDVMIDYVSKLN